MGRQMTTACDSQVEGGATGFRSRNKNSLNTVNSPIKGVSPVFLGSPKLLRLEGPDGLRTQDRGSIDRVQTAPIGWTPMIST